MKFRFILLLTLISFVFTVSACSKKNDVTTTDNREIVLRNDNTNEERNKLLKEDIKYLKENLPKLHINMFTYITKEEFNKRMDELISNVDKLNNKKVFVNLNKIIASIGDAHTNISYWDGYAYPLMFWIFDGKVYVINADASLSDMMYTEVVKIDGVDIKTIIDELTTLIPHENESWVLSNLPNYLSRPVYMYGLDIIKNEEAIFTVLKDGVEKDFTVPTLGYEENVNFVNQSSNDVILGTYEKYYDYEYMPEQKTIYFEYNVCDNMEDLSFKDFNKELFKVIKENEVRKIIIDLRNNFGGNSEILNPFTNELKKYIKSNPDVKVYTLVGRNTFSSGMFAIYRIKEAAPDAISVGEPTGGALDCYGEIKSINLPNSQIPVWYSTKFFEFSKSFSYKNEGITTFIPDVFCEATMKDYKNGVDTVLQYVLNN